MVKIIKLKESHVNNIVKKVLNEVGGYDSIDIMGIHGGSVQGEITRIVSQTVDFMNEFSNRLRDGSLSKEELIKAKHNLLKNDIEISLIKLLAEWPNILEKSRKMLEPHRCVFFLNDLASLFHSFWSMGKDNEKLRFIIPGNIELTKARMSLIYGVMTIISSALKIFGVKPVKEMH